MRIIFVGDWVKFKGNWRQVVDIDAGDLIQIFGGNDPIWINAEDARIQQVRSDPEMQRVLETV